MTVILAIFFFCEYVFSKPDNLTHTVTVRILDEKGQPSPARVRFTDLNSAYYAPEGHNPDFPVVNWAYKGGDRDNVMLDDGRRFAYTDGQFSISLPIGDISVEVVKGFAYRILTDTVTISEGTDRLDVKLERWFRFKDNNWYSGDVHTHFISPEMALLEMKAEDLNVCEILTTDVTTDQDWFQGSPDKVSEDKHIVYVNQEYREDRLGHIIFLKLKKLISPVTTMRQYQYPLNSAGCDEVHAQGGITVLAHFSQNQGFEWPLDVVTGKVDGLDFMDCILPFEPATSGMWYLIPDHQGNSGMRLWYRMLNCGFKMPVMAGTDKGSNRVTIGANRVYAYIDNSFNYDSWISALKEGRSFITNSPFLFLRINGKMPGDIIHLKQGEPLEIQTEVWCQFPLDRLEIIASGEVIAEQFISGKGEHNSLSVEYTPGKSCWITARAYESPLKYKKNGVSFSLNRFRGDGKTPFNRYYGTEAPEVSFAHTNPVYVTVDGKPIRSRIDAEYYAHFLENAVHYLRTEGTFPSEEAKQDVINQFKEGKQAFIDIAKDE